MGSIQSTLMIARRYSKTQNKDYNLKIETRNLICEKANKAFNFAVF